MVPQSYQEAPSRDKLTIGVFSYGLAVIERVVIRRLSFEVNAKQAPTKHRGSNDRHVSGTVGRCKSMRKDAQDDSMEEFSPWAVKDYCK